MKPSDAKLIADLTEAEARATPGTWMHMSTEVHAAIDGHGVRVLKAEFDMVWVRLVNAQDNARFVALARSALPRLLALVREQDEALRHAAVVACAPSAKTGETMAAALAGLRASLDVLMPGWNEYGLDALASDGTKTL